MHDELRSGSIWYDEDVRDYFMSTVDARQFPSNCTKNTWIVHREHDSGTRLRSELPSGLTASHELFLTQPLRTRMIKNTGDELGMDLFVLNHRRLSPLVSALWGCCCSNFHL